MLPFDICRIIFSLVSKTKWDFRQGALLRLHLSHGSFRMVSPSLLAKTWGFWLVPGYHLWYLQPSVVCSPFPDSSSHQTRGPATCCSPPRTPSDLSTHFWLAPGWFGSHSMTTRNNCWQTSQSSLPEKLGCAPEIAVVRSESRCNSLSCLCDPRMAKRASWQGVTAWVRGTGIRGSKPKVT